MEVNVVVSLAGEYDVRIAYETFWEHVKNRVIYCKVVSDRYLSVASIVCRRSRLSCEPSWRVQMAVLYA